MSKARENAELTTEEITGKSGVNCATTEGSREVLI